MRFTRPTLSPFASPCRSSHGCAHAISSARKLARFGKIEVIVRCLRTPSYAPPGSGAAMCSHQCSHHVMWLFRCMSQPSVLAPYIGYLFEGASLYCHKRDVLVNPQFCCCLSLAQTFCQVLGGKVPSSPVARVCELAPWRRPSGPGSLCTLFALLLRLFVRFLQVLVPGDFLSLVHGYLYLFRSKR